MTIPVEGFSGVEGDRFASGFGYVVGTCCLCTYPCRCAGVADVACGSCRMLIVGFRVPFGRPRSCPCGVLCRDASTGAHGSPVEVGTLLHD